MRLCFPAKPLCPHSELGQKKSGRYLDGPLLIIHDDLLKLGAADAGDGDQGI
jgi:hypothetical protein